jgi:hypothetical protein
MAKYNNGWGPPPHTAACRMFFFCETSSQFLEKQFLFTRCLPFLDIFNYEATHTLLPRHWRFTRTRVVVYAQVPSLH